MSQPNSISALQKEAEADVGKITKLLKKVKKAISKEFLMLLGSVLLGMPVSYLLYIILQQLLGNPGMYQLAQLTEEVPLFMWCYAIAVAGCYFSRMVFSAIQSLTKKGSG